eukprot:1177440-Prorocentrum_minimum.AAC.2
MILLTWGIALHQKGRMFAQGRGTCHSRPKPGLEETYLALARVFSDYERVLSVYARAHARFVRAGTLNGRLRDAYMEPLLRMAIIDEEDIEEEFPDTPPAEEDEQEQVTRDWSVLRVWVTRHSRAQAAVGGLVKWFPPPPETFGRRASGLRPDKLTVSVPSALTN